MTIIPPFAVQCNSWNRQGTCVVGTAWFNCLVLWRVRIILHNAGCLAQHKLSLLAKHSLLHCTEVTSCPAQRWWCGEERWRLREESVVCSPEAFGALSSPSLSVSVSPSLGSPVIYQSCCQIVHARTFRLFNTCLLCAITTCKYPP